MRGRILDQGHFELQETQRGRRMLIFNDKNTYVWEKAEGRERLWLTEGATSRSGDKNFHVLNRGHYFIILSEDDPEYPWLPHLYLEHEDHYDEFILLDGLPDMVDIHKEILFTNKTIPAHQIETFAHHR